MQQDDSSLALLLDEEGYEMEQHNQGRSFVVIAAVTAHAMNDAFKAAFKLHHDSGVPIRWIHKKVLPTPSRTCSSLEKGQFLLGSPHGCFYCRSPYVILSPHNEHGHPNKANALQAYYNKIWKGISGNNLIWLLTHLAFRTPD
jgi:hypothetical protein